MRSRVRKPEEEDLLAKAQRYLPGGTTGNINSTPEEAFVVREGRGSRVWDASGNEYIDYLLGSGPLVLGHAHPAVVSAVRDHLERGSTYFAVNEQAILLAEEIVRAVPCAEQVRFTSSGSEATLFAMRLARAHRRKEKILRFEGSFHGTNDYALMAPDVNSPRESPQVVAGSAGIPKAVGETVLMAPFNDLEATTAIIEEHHDELAGVIMEAFQRIIPPKPGFLEGVRQATSQYGIPLIFDEIVTGFRFAYGGAQEYYGVVPDIASLGKIVGGGFPLAAVCGSAEIMAHFDPAMQGSGDYVPQIGTLSGNPIASVAGLATLKELRKEGTYERLFAMGNQLKESLERLLREVEIPAQVVGDAPLFDVCFTPQEVTDYRSILTADEGMLKRFNKALLERGILKSDHKIYVGVIHSSDDVQQTVEAMTSAIKEVAG